MVTLVLCNRGDCQSACPCAAVGLPQYSLALVRGEKEAEIALREGKYPVIDVLTDVFAIPSTSGEW